MPSPVGRWRHRYKCDAIIHDIARNTKTVRRMWVEIQFLSLRTVLRTIPEKSSFVYLKQFEKSLLLVSGDA